MKNFILFSMLLVGLMLTSCSSIQIITEPGTETTPPPSKTPTTPKTTKKTNKVDMKPTGTATTKPRESGKIKKPVTKRPKSNTGSNKSGNIIKKPTRKPSGNSMSQKTTTKPATRAASRRKAVLKPTPPPKRVVKSKPVRRKPVVKARTAQKAKKKVAKISLDHPRYNFGTIKEGTIIKRDFKFTNTGKEDLLIEIATGSCGCTVPEWPAKPIKPGETGVIHVTFDSTDKEYDTRVEVNIVANTEPIVTEIIMTGKVIPKRDLKKKKG